jgi:lipoprotein-anchoring transpeptidase ErfK/SrfK
MWVAPRVLVVVGSVAVCACVSPVSHAAAKGHARKSTACARVLGGRSDVAGPTNRLAWKARLESRIGVYDHLPGKTLQPSTWVAPKNAPWLLVVARPRVAGDRCWVRVRLPWRPNTAAAWINANLVVAEKTEWRIDVSTSRRTLTLFKAGKPVRTVSVVVGKPSTPTPTGLFAVAWAVRWNPNDFLGSWVLELTAHSDALQQFDGGDGMVGIHGRGGASLLDPLGSSLSHGCIRLANDSIDWLVATIGQSRLPGTPVQVSS